MKLTINNETFESFSKYEIQLNFAAVASSFTFSGLKNFLPEVLSYPVVEIKTDDERLLLTGTITNQNYSISSNPELVSLSGYGKAGILEDCNINEYPLQLNNLSLREILNKLLAPFNINYSVNASISSELNKKYIQTTADPTQSIKSYIAQLASQRNVIITHDAEGDLVFTRIDTSKLEPIATFDEGEGAVKISLEVDGQSLHSDIKVIRQASLNNPDAGEFTIKNPYVSVFRPTTKISSAGDIFDVEKAARNELSSELQNIKIIITCLKPVYPGNLIELKAPSLGINKFVPLFVEQTNIIGTVTSETYVLTCLIKECYNNDPVINIFQ